MAKLEISGLDEVLDRMRAFPQRANRMIGTALEAALLVIWSNVPAYPPQPETDYIRTGTLGRSLGSGESGGQAGGQPEIYEVRAEMSGYYQASFGTRLEYAPHVIGDSTTQQARHLGYWWTLPQTVAQASLEGIKKVFQVLKEEMVLFLEGRR